MIQLRGKRWCSPEGRDRSEKALAFVSRLETRGTRLKDGMPEKVAAADAAAACTSLERERGILSI